jgi:hypothetical protein
MKNKFLSLCFLGCAAFLMMGADLRQPVVVKVIPKKVCVGYTIIEAGKGVDCNGDTIALVKRGGFYEVAERKASQRLGEIK